MCLDQRVEAETLRLRQQSFDLVVGKVSEEEERCVRSRLLRHPEIVGGREEPFREQGASVAARAARRSSHVPANRSSTSTEIAEAPAAA